ncbi:hypothetical protein JCM19039_4307 [Geomicrobium sp. JCM 19039]|nr:hypothetical protein JCM19039_4307 [Geomicrobium sp. JCM 19039]
MLISLKQYIMIFSCLKIYYSMKTFSVNMNYQHCNMNRSFESKKEVLYERDNKPTILQLF